MSIIRFISKARIEFKLDDPASQLRNIRVTDINKVDSNGHEFSQFVADRAPTYYRDIKDIIDSLRDKYFLTTIAETLAKIPDSEHFQSSHFGEIVSSIFLEDGIEWPRLYSKLSQNTTENQNAYKMDILCYDPKTDPVEFIFCEVKSSPKHANDGMPPEHHKSCYADIFNSLKKYDNDDLKFDLTAIKDRLQLLDEDERNKVRNALKPYGDRSIKYLGIAIIDHSTYLDDEVGVLAKRKSIKEFDAELICIEAYKDIANETYERLNALKSSTGI